MLPDIHKHLENKYMNKNRIESKLIFIVQIPQGFVEMSFERLWDSYLVHITSLKWLGSVFMLFNELNMNPKAFQMTSQQVPAGFTR